MDSYSEAKHLSEGPAPCFKHTLSLINCPDIFWTFFQNYFVAKIKRLSSPVLTQCHLHIIVEALMVLRLN